ncbi:hypothetical protein LX32DRAFT_454450 [Colletotrichum zoysiae]|uniref:Uncharacterized protein n=1 Tax=Colletotrichum zoysiae TaxID=1216348 RepID=A0AAD9M2U0_9PEZI|nr:hypothetical protein LX32DRAFT_454450 [Colletotrichum zoysiae]
MKSPTMQLGYEDATHWGQGVTFQSQRSLLPLPAHPFHPGYLNFPCKTRHAPFIVETRISRVCFPFFVPNQRT